MNKKDQTITKVNTTFGSEYVKALQQLEKFKGCLPAEDYGRELISAGYKLVDILENVALYGQAITSNLDLMLDATQTMDDERIAKIRSTRDYLSGLFSSEALFCANMEQMHRDRILNAAGIDPTDTDAVCAHFKRVSDALLFTAQKSNN